MSYQSSVMTAWKQVNQASASLHLTGAAPAFRQAVARTDWKSLIPVWEFGDFKVYVVESLEGQLVWVDGAQSFAVVGRDLWTILSSDFDVLDHFVEDLANGASGVKVIDYDSGPYRAAGVAWREMHQSMTPAPDALTALQERLEHLLARTQAIAADKRRTSEQYQALYVDLAGAGEAVEQIQSRVRGLEAMLDLARDAVGGL